LRYGNRIEIRELKIPDVKLIVPKRLSDARGHFSEIWSEQLFRKQIANVTFAQDNQSMSVKKGTLRGLHFQRPPFLKES
jgi:dTDP-4-dehydrorhamnose 3,5-epimerase